VIPAHTRIIKLFQLVGERGARERERGTIKKQMNITVKAMTKSCSYFFISYLHNTGSIYNIFQHILHSPTQCSLSHFCYILKYVAAADAEI
jgi:hypothetical protein